VYSGGVVVVVVIGIVVVGIVIVGVGVVVIGVEVVVTGVEVGVVTVVLSSPVQEASTRLAIINNIGRIIYRNFIIASPI
jgi:hypothetical protein